MITRSGHIGFFWFFNSPENYLPVGHVMGEGLWYCF